MKRNHLTEEVGWFNTHERREEAITTSDDELLALARSVLGLDRKKRQYIGCGNDAHAKQANAQIAATRSALEGRLHHVVAMIERHNAEVQRLTRERDEARNAADYAEALTARTINERESAEAALATVTRERDEALAAVRDTLAKLGDRTICERLDAAEAALSAAQKRIAELEAHIEELSGTVDAEVAATLAGG